MQTSASYRATYSKTLLRIWKQVKAKSFLNYNVDIKKQDGHLEEFKALSLAEQNGIFANSWIKTNCM